MKLARFSPKNGDVVDFHAQLFYALGSMMEKESACVNGVAVIADFTDFSMANFGVPFFHKMLAILQGRHAPIRVTNLIILNPPSWFGTIWKVMKTMMSADFLDRVFRITFNDLGKVLLPGFENMMPNDVFLGKRNAQQVLEMWIQERKQVEAMRILNS